MLLIAVGFFSCYKDKFNLNKLEKNGDWSPDVAVPLIYSNMTMKDLLNDYNHDNLYVNDTNNLLYLVYWNKIYSRTAEELLGIPNQSLNTNFQFSVTGSLPWGTDITAPLYTAYYSFNTHNNIIIDNVTLNSGTFDFIISIPGFTHNATINISIPSATIGGIPFSQDIAVIGSATTTEHLNLSGYNIVFDNTGGNQNRLAITYTVTVHGQGSANNSPYSVTMGESFNNLVFEEIHGDFKQLGFNFPDDSIKLRLFTYNIQGTIDFENPKLHVYATNSFGMPVRINLNNLKTSSGINAPYQVLITGVPIPWDINAAPSVGDSATTVFHLYRTNSNIWDAISIAPQWITTNITGLSNPSGVAASNFATASSRFDINTQIELPLDGKAWNFVLQDTIACEFGTDIDAAEYVDFRINTQNGFPVEAITQLFFVDANNHILDSLLTPEQQIVVSALCGGAPEYRVYETVHKLTDTRFEKARMTGIKDTKKIIIRGKLATSQNGTQIVKIYSDYELEVRLAARAKFNVAY